MPTIVGISAAATLPKMIRLRISTIGIAMVSARAMSSLTWVLTSSKTTVLPGDVRLEPGCVEVVLDQVVGRHLLLGVRARRG